MKTIFICEYVTGGGYINKKISKKLFVQANIILKSLLNDFNKIPNLKIIYTWDYRYKEITKRKRTQCVFIKKKPWKIWSQLIKKSDFFFPIAPESNGDLLKIVKFGNSQKKNLIGSNIVAIKIASSKYKTYKLFKKYSIPTITTFKNIKKINYKNNNKWVIKPDDGAGCEKNYIFSDKNKRLFFLDSFPYKSLFNVTASADVGCVLIKPNSINNKFALPNKLFEYAAVGLPVIATDLPEMNKAITENKLGHCVSFGDDVILIKTIEKVLLQEADRKYEPNYQLFWEAQADNFLEIL